MVRATNVFKSIQNVDKEKLDAITSDPFFTHEWLITLETVQPLKIEPAYITVNEEDELLAFAPCFLDLDHHYDWYEETPCYKHTQVEDENTFCRIGNIFTINNNPYLKENSENESMPKL